ncbi:MAG TPA: cytochrome C [Burkholderiales bacterium]|nr:cytochrome C [Burkholderiales bacterium]
MTKPATTRSWLAALAGACLLLAAVPGVAADLERGRLLHATFCLGCHNDSVTKRENRVAGTYAELRRQVARWQANAGLKWEAQDVDDVTAWLNATHYRLPCEGAGC